VAGCKVGADQTFLAAEEVVQRTLRYPCVFDDAVDADRLDALGVEQLVRRCEEPVARQPRSTASRCVVRLGRRFVAMSVVALYAAESSSASMISTRSA
jgi:hypothetical protein